MNEKSSSLVWHGLLMALVTAISAAVFFNTDGFRITAPVPESVFWQVTDLLVRVFLPSASLVLMVAGAIGCLWAGTILLVSSIRRGQH